MNKTILLIPHYNNLSGLFKSIRSIKKSDYIDVLIVDDGSKIKIDEALLKETYEGCGEIYIKFLKKNRGIEYALNKGLEIINEKGYTFIARLDCGDINLNNRFHKQERFLENNKEVGMVGSNVHFFREENTVFKLKLPIHDEEIRKRMYENSMLIHPTIMFKTQVIKEVGLYPTEYKYAEDLAYFFNVMKKFKLANIDEYLVACELNSNGISIKNRKAQLKSRIKLILENFYFGFYPLKGLLKTLLLFLIPVRLITFLKSIKN